MRRFITVIILVAGYCLSRAADWPQLLGPDRNGVAREANVAARWTPEGPPVLWKFSAGEGWSGPVVASNRAVLFHRRGDKALVDCLDAVNGKSLWQASYATGYRDDFGFEEGPRATPAVDGHRVFTFGAEGMLHAWDLAGGDVLWKVDTASQYKSDKGFFGRACSPLVEGNAVILNIGGASGAGIVAFDKSNGKLLWKATDQDASYSSPVAANIGGARYLFVLGRSGLVALDPVSGGVLWEHAFQPAIRASVTAATPLVMGDRIFISASYGAGAVLLKFDRAKPSLLWSGDDMLSNHYGTSAHRDGLLFGFHGRQEERCHFRAVELATGRVRWNEEHFGAGHIIIVGDRLLVLTERGELLVAPALGKAFEVSARAQILGSDCRAHPAFAAGKFYARDKRTLVCVDLQSGN